MSNIDVTNRMLELSAIQRLKWEINHRACSEAAEDAEAKSCGFVIVRRCGVCLQTDEPWNARVRPDTPHPQFTCHRCMGLPKP